MSANDRYAEIVHVQTIPSELAFNLVDPKAYADENRVQDTFTFLRREMPLALAEIEGFHPFWAVTKHADILEVERDGELFHAGDHANPINTIEGEAFVQKMVGGPHLVRSLVQMDNPDHLKHRMLTQNWFMPPNLRKLEEDIRVIARGFVDHMAGLGTECDFARDVAFLYPLHVVMKILGVPESDEPLMLKLTQELFGPDDPDNQRNVDANLSPEDRFNQMAGTVMQFTEYFNAITEDRRANPKDDVASVIANGEIDGEPLGDFEASGYYTILAAAGHDTTSGSTAGGLWALCENPDEFRKLKDNLDLIPSYVDETIRWTTPVKHFMRFATADAELRGEKISKGDRLMLCYSSGNRDEEVFEDPFKFSVERKANKHVAFGYGAHVCLGQHLAKMEMRIFWEELIPRLDEVELNGTPQRTQANFVCGPKSVPIKFKMH